jgi:putative ABC transport system ATP-binding protein
VTAVISCRGVSHRYWRRGLPPVVAVDDVSLDVAAGEFVAVQGPSGSGKTTLLALLAGIESADAGTVQILGHDLSRLSVAERARLRRIRMGIVFQSFGLVHSLSAGENVALPLALDGMSPDDRKVQASAALESVGLGDLYGARIDELSGGQRQRVGVARAIAARPQLVLADEPTGSLDDETAASILELLRRTAATLGASLVLVTHDTVSASQADRRYLMRDGRLSAAGAAQ